MQFFKAEYLQMMREQAPARFKRLSKSGELEKEALRASREAAQMLRSLLEHAPKEKDGQPTLQARREAEEQVPCGNVRV